MSSILHLSLRYLAHHRFKASLLTAALALVLAIPACLAVLTRQGEIHLRERAAATPLLIGAKGSPLELVLNSLYFRSKAPPSLHYAEVAKIADSGLALPIPLYVRYRCQGDPIVATSVDYFKFRQLEIKEGHPMVRLGDCVLGSNVGRRRGLHPGDSLVSTPEQTFDVAGTFPLKMRVTGILAPANSPDDDAVFADVKTAWIIEGIGHGHGDTSKGGANASLVNGELQPYTEVTDANAASFHFHGETGTFPITAILAVPNDERDATRLIGRYQAAENPCQIAEPGAVMGELLDTVVTVKKYALAALGLVAVVAFGLVGLIEALSIRLRHREIQTLAQIGGSRGRIAALLASEGLACLFAGAAIAAGMTALTALYAGPLTQAWISS